MTVAANEPITTSRGLKLRFQPEDRYIAVHVEKSGQWEEDVAYAIESYLKPNWTFLDLGAHVGYFSLLAAQRCEHVIAVEANPDAADLLAENAFENGLAGKIELCSVGVADWEGSGALRMDPEYGGNVGAAYLSEEPDGLKVQHLRDIVGDRRPEFIKIDIEGLEQRVILDAPEVFHAAKVVVCELSPRQLERYGGSVKGLLVALRVMDFEVFTADGTLIQDDSVLESLKEYEYMNLVCRKTQRATLILCAYRSLMVETAECMFTMRDRGWGHIIGRGDALVQRVRSRVVTKWYTQTQDDVFLMIDDDIVFSPEDAERVVALAREKRGIACGAYPVKDGTHLACRAWPGQVIEFGKNTFPREDMEPVEIKWPATGFMAVHRDVIEAMVESGELPLCGSDEHAMYPFFDTFWLTEGDQSVYLSEDYAFGERALRLGFKVWLDPATILFHLGQFPYQVHNMVGDRVRHEEAKR